MPNKTFLSFIWPSLLAMILFIALPIVSVAYQSLFVELPQQLVEVESCGPFGCQTELRVDSAAMEELREQNPMGRFNGLGTYTNASHLAFGEVAQAWQTSANIGDFVRQLLNLPFYKALIFTITYTFVVTPLVVLVGFVVALAINALNNWAKGPAIFLSLLPMIVTPLVGSLVLFWMIDSQGVIGATLQQMFADPQLSLKASPGLTWVVLFAYGVWHSAPFAFIVFYAGLQTVPRDTLESAMVDGANRWERVRSVVIPHLMPLATFIGLMQLMDNFRVFEPIIGFSASASATSLSYLIYSDLRAGDFPLFGSAAATSVLTIAGVAVLLTPVLMRTWRDFKRKG